MTTNGQKEKIGDDALAGNGKPTDLNIEGDNHNAETYDHDHGEEDVGQTDDIPKKPSQSAYYKEDNLQVWKDRCLQRDEEVKEMVNKLADLQSVVNFMMQNNVMQLPFLLHDTPVPKNNTQRGGQIPVAPQHNGSRRHSHQTSREVGRGGSRREESQRTRHTKEADPKEHRDVQGQALSFDTSHREGSKRAHHEAESSVPKKLKSKDSRAPGRSKEDLRDYLKRRQQNVDAEVTSPVKPRTPFSVELDKFEAPKRFSMPRFQIYDGKSDPNFHVGLYLNSMALYSGSEPFLCKVFPFSFGEIASDWFHKLPKGSVQN
ncbi:hypothetical protein ACSBR1_017709 [Camellia fascicularis]